MYLNFDTAPNDIWKYFYKTLPNSEPINGTNVAAVSKNNECFISNSYFNANTEEGVITYKINDNKMLISDCLFYECNATGTGGGAINFNCNSSIVQYRTCGYKSTVADTDKAHHAYIKLPLNTININYLYASSFLSCGDSVKQNTNYIYQGKNRIKSINTSSCEAIKNAGIYFLGPTTIGNITYSTFSQNKADDQIIAFSSKKYQMHHCNILNNSLTTTSSGNKGTCYAYQAAVQIDHCSFFGNSPTTREFSVNVFSNKNSITVKDCFFDKENKGDSFAYGNVIFENNISEYYLNQLPHLSTNKCEAQYQLTLPTKAVIKDLKQMIYNVRRKH